MRAARMLIRAQIKSKKGSYISIFILTLMIGLMLSFSLSLVVNIRSAALEAVEASKFGDLLRARTGRRRFSPVGENAGN
jgi:sensor histidine kinase regulating citrate/malate metabolism